MLKKDCRKVDKPDGNDEQPSKTTDWRPWHVSVGGWSPSTARTVIEQEAKKWSAALPDGIKSH